MSQNGFCLVLVNSFVITKYEIDVNVMLSFTLQAIQDMKNDRTT